MYQNNVELKDEKKNKKRGMFYSVTLHLLLLLIAIWPFLNQAADIDKNFAIVVEFEKPIVVKKSGSQSKAAAKSSSSDPAANESQEDAKPSRQVQEIQQIQKTEIKPASKPIEEVITAPDITTPKWPEPVEAPEKIETTVPDASPSSEVTTETSIEDFLPVLDKIIEEESGAGSGDVAGDNDFDPNSSGSGGTGGTGSGKRDNDGSAAGSGNGNAVPPGDFGDGLGDGIGGAGFDGEGPLTRRVKYRPECAKDLAYQDAVIKLDLCINRDGAITYSKYNVRKSSVKDKSYARQITNCFRNIVFEKDNSAPSKECGIYTYRYTFKQ